MATIEDIAVVPFAVPLLEPFTISRASVDTTRAVAVVATLRDGSRSERGFGEAALPLGDSMEPSELAETIARAAARIRGRVLATLEDAAELAGAELGPVARSALHCALLDAWSRLAGQPLHAVLGAPDAVRMNTDVTLPIAEPAHLAELAKTYWQRGFRCFKVKVGADLAADRRTVELIATATPQASLRFDANEGFGADDALALLATTREAGLEVECFEQPCGRADVEGMRRVRAEGGVSVVADEAARSEADLDRLEGAVDGINLKLVKMGGIDRCLAIGRLAQARGLQLMVGAMIESRLGLTAMGHVVAALGGVAWVDLDTAFLLARDPCRGGMQAEGPWLTLPAAPGLGLEIDLEATSQFFMPG